MNRFNTTPFNTLFQSVRNRILFAIAIALFVGVCYGIALRLNFADNVMGAGFIVLMPIAAGFLTVWASPENLRKRLIYAFFAPWAMVFILSLSVIFGGLEGLICVLFIVPIFGGMASIGGMFAWFLEKRRRERSGFSNTIILASFLFVPIVAIPVEEQLPIENRTIRTVASEIRIRASKERVWQNIIRVRAIAPEEQATSFFHRIGFPKPLEATLSYEGVGGVRHASFEGGVVFTETITEWHNHKKIRFRIKANTEAIPPATLDEHVTIGGKYFDILTGMYELEEQGNDVVLRLYSEQRLSTNVNIYVGLWTEAVMQDIQTNILNVIKRRCEAAL